MIVRVRSRDGLERVTVPNPNATVAELKTLIESQLKVPAAQQTLSMDKDLLLCKTADEIRRFTDLSNPWSTFPSLGIGHGSLIYLSYDHTIIERTIPPPPLLTPAGSFGRKMTMDDLIAKQVRVTRQETSPCESVSFDRSAADAFQHYVNDSLAFAVKRCGFMYGTVSDAGRVEVDFIYEPPQSGTEAVIYLLRDSTEEAAVEAVAAGLGMRAVGFMFTQAVGQDKEGYTLSETEVRLAAQMQVECGRGLEQWVTAVVKLEVSEDGGADVHFEAFQLSEMCVKLFREGWFLGDEAGPGTDPKVTRLKKEVVVGVKDVKEVDNDFFLVPVKISDHQGLLSTTFPIENRNSEVTMRALKTHLDRTKSLPFVKRISDFHLLLFLARYFDVNADVPALAECVQGQITVPEGFKLIIESLASSA
ncbi:NPL4-like protein 2 [Acorus gramineus]|uniref:NPL4-like protein 2 n=1 Tax=Acorus gramineus TaxID=55184 RepID=A0AAV9BNV1_ACOGR|nr:NPL4-like protein 2 [Acorus gramineus]